MVPSPCLKRQRHRQRQWQSPFLASTFGRRPAKAAEAANAAEAAEPWLFSGWCLRLLRKATVRLLQRCGLLSSSLSWTAL